MLEILNQNRARRSFQMVVGLQKGYEKGKFYTFNDVEQIILDWLVQQKKAHKIYLSGQLSEGRMLYMHEEPYNEAVITFSGEVSPLLFADRSNEEILQALFDLAEEISIKLKQERIYLTYCEELFILAKK